MKPNNFTFYFIILRGGGGGGGAQSQLKMPTACELLAMIISSVCRPASRIPYLRSLAIAQLKLGTSIPSTSNSRNGTVSINAVVILHGKRGCSKLNNRGFTL